MIKAKRAMSSTAVNLIVLLVVLFGLIFFGARIFLYANNQTQSSACSLGTLTTNGADAIKKTGFFKTYEINCKAVHYVWTQSNLQPNSVPAEAAVIEPNIAREEKDFPERMQLVLKDKISEQLETCWKITGNRRLISEETVKDKWWDYIVLGSVSRATAKDLFLQNKIGYTSKPKGFFAKPYFGNSVSYTNDLPLVACMVCSTNHIADDVSIPASVDLKSYLDKKPFTGGNVNMSTILSAKKSGYPKQVMYGKVDSSVLYYQLYEELDQDFDMSRLGVMVLPTESIPTFCDVMLNRG